jgi:hypothetical protein
MFYMFKYFSLATPIVSHICAPKRRDNADGTPRMPRKTLAIYRKNAESDMRRRAPHVGFGIFSFLGGRLFGWFWRENGQIQKLHTIRRFRHEATGDPCTTLWLGSNCPHMIRAIVENTVLSDRCGTHKHRDLDCRSSVVSSRSLRRHRPFLMPPNGKLHLELFL